MKKSLVLLVGIGVLTCWGGLRAGELKGHVKAIGARHNGDAVVYVEAVPGKTFPAPTEHAEVDQKDMEFVPHVLPVLVGTTVDFKNSDAVLHNVFTPDKCAEKFNLGSWPQGQARSYTFKKVCAATLLCNVHPEMEGFVVAVPTPYFAVTDRTGAYDIKDLPDGTYTVKVWHPRLKETSKEVTVAGATTVDFEVKK
ncbi:MAG: carboxypeptidase regulatory-like domain-containing protein [Acidobacteriota bacterium]